MYRDDQIKTDIIATATHESCSQCGSRFVSKKRLNEHIKRVHVPASERTCPHCKQVFSNAGSLPAHTRICQQRSMAQEVSCSLPDSAVPVSPSSPHVKAKSAKQGYVSVERYLTRLVAYLEAGNFTYSPESRMEPLASLTILSYKSFVRKFLEAIIQGLILNYSEGTKSLNFIFT